MKLFKALFVAGLVFSSAVFVTPILAGGGLVYLSVDGYPYGTQGRIIRFHLNPSEISCKGREVTLKFEDPMDKDSITVGTPTQPYIIPEDASWYHYNGIPAYKDCASYAKVVSAKKGERTLYLEVKMPDGKIYTSSRLVAQFDGVDYGLGDDTPPWGQDVLARVKKEAAVSADLETIRPTASSTAMASVQPSSTSKAEVTSSSTASVSAQDPDLIKKVANLQKQLDESKRRQSDLEHRLNNLISWIKSILPFFK